MVKFLFAGIALYTWLLDFICISLHVFPWPYQWQSGLTWLLRRGGGSGKAKHSNLYTDMHRFLLSPQFPELNSERKQSGRTCSYLSHWYTLIAMYITTDYIGNQIQNWTHCSVSYWKPTLALLAGPSDMLIFLPWFISTPYLHVFVFAIIFFPGDYTTCISKNKLSQISKEPSLPQIYKHVSFSVYLSAFLKNFNSIQS